MNSRRALVLLSVLSIQLAFSQANPASGSPLRVSPEAAKAHLVRYVEPHNPGATLNDKAVVKLHAVIAKDGSISTLKVLEGHPLLFAAAIEAARQWKYRPFVRNGRRISVQAEISVEFQSTRRE